VKTHKVPELAALQLAAGACGITVAKVGEAEVMAAGGVRDIFIAYPLVTEAKIRRAMDLVDRCRVIFAVDSIKGARMLSKAAVERGVRAEVRLEIETGMRRTGVPIADVGALCEEIASLGAIEIGGIFTFRGALLEGRPTLDRRAAGLDEARTMVALAERLRLRGIGIRDVSVGSTPTAEFACTVPGVTEIRPGTYIFNDRMQAAYGDCTIEDCALSVLVTVVSAPAPDRIIVDGGSKTFSTDVAPGNPPLELRGYGEVVGAPELLLERMSEEHGVITLPPGRRFEVGDRLKVVPNHVCTTVNLHDSLWIIEDGAEGTGGARELRIAARGCVR
jgi:D-serine deaminase-like pyridoxal phosphate-dependent protein